MIPGAFRDTDPSASAGRTFFSLAFPSRSVELRVCTVECAFRDECIFRAFVTRILIAAQSHSRAPSAFAESRFFAPGKIKFRPGGLTYSVCIAATRIAAIRELIAADLYGRMIPEWKLSNAIIIPAGALKIYIHQHGASTCI